MGRFHVLVDAFDGDIEVQVEREDGAGDQHNENREGRVLKIRDLDLHRSKLDPPAYIVLRWRGFEADMLPVRRLQVFKMVRGFQIQSLQVLGKDDYRVTDKQVGEMCCEQ